MLEKCDVMSLIRVVMKRALFLFRLIGAILRRLLCCFKRKKNIGELPYTIVHQSPQTFSEKASGNGHWEGWGDSVFVTSVEEKIKEYRRKKEELETVSEENNGSDYFNDMQPKVIQTKKVCLVFWK
ncbi:unnamed protein product [Thelazia callipaeda]|uniref:Uncharacterized protein n=1 Tax=Thelazia callipaeda TaxID=103827 RepID=A0A0N5CSE9_THECL|nr:unnamed protein product [Thelazia callipaeda]